MTTIESSQSAPADRILIVDDDKNLLDALVRMHRRNYELVTANGPVAGLDAVRTSGPFAVIVSDYAMPVMDGATFLRKVQDLAPESVRMMLTGNSDLQTAVNAVNQGAVFRFMRKPCEPEVFAAGLNLALRQHQLQQAEKQLLEQTLQGSIQVLTDVLSMVNPQAFGRARRVRHYTRQMVDKLQWKPIWEFETAALLSQLGCVTVPPELLATALAGAPLSGNEQEVLDRHPQTAAQLLKHIPRLEGIAAAIAHQRTRFDSQPDLPEVARVLAVALGLEQLVHGGRGLPEAAAVLRGQKGVYDPVVLAVADQVEVLGTDCVMASLTISKLRIGMVLAEDVHNDQGLLVVPKGQEVTQTLLTRLRNYSELKRIPLQIKVQIDAAQPTPA